MNIELDVEKNFKPYETGYRLILLMRSDFTLHHRDSVHIKNLYAEVTLVTNQMEWLSNNSFGSHLMLF